MENAKIDEIWKEMEEMVYAGTVRAIGVCNLTAPQLEVILEIARIRPCAISFEHHPWMSQTAFDDLIAMAHR